MTFKCEMCKETFDSGREHFSVINEPFCICNECAEKIFEAYQVVGQEMYLYRKDMDEFVGERIEESLLNSEDKEFARKILHAYATDDMDDKESKNIRQLVDLLVFGMNPTDIKKAAEERLGLLDFPSEEKSKFDKLIQSYTVGLSKNVLLNQIVDMIAGYEDGYNKSYEDDDDFEDDDDDFDEDEDDDEVGDKDLVKDAKLQEESDRKNHIRNIASMIGTVKEFIKGQDEGVVQIGRLLFRHCMRMIHNQNHPDDPIVQKENFLIVGPTGVGKTATIEEFCRLLKLPVVSIDMTSITKAGYVGADVSEYFLQLKKKAGGNQAMAEIGIVILDEGDKNMNNGVARHDDPGGTAVMFEMLRKVEGCDVALGHGNFINTKNMLFICVGTFEEAYKKRKERITGKKQLGFGAGQSEKPLDRNSRFIAEDLEKSGAPREWIGRFPNIVEYKALGHDELVDILLNSSKSPFVQNKKYLKFAYGVDVDLLPEGVEQIVEKTIKYGIGARGLVRVVSEMIEEVETKLILEQDRSYSKIIIGENVTIE